MKWIEEVLGYFKVVFWQDWENPQKPSARLAAAPVRTHIWYILNIISNITASINLLSNTEENHKTSLKFRADFRGG
jgi:hypothetical protein